MALDSSALEAAAGWATCCVLKGSSALQTLLFRRSYTDGSWIGNQIAAAGEVCGASTQVINLFEVRGSLRSFHPLDYSSVRAADR